MKNRLIKINFLAILFAVLASLLLSASCEPVSNATAPPPEPELQVAANQYLVVNKTEKQEQIWWRDGSWTSGDVDYGAHHPVDSDHNALVTMYAKDEKGNNIELGVVEIPLGGSVTIFGKWNWNVRP